MLLNVGVPHHSVRSDKRCTVVVSTLEPAEPAKEPLGPSKKLDSIQYRFAALQLIGLRLAAAFERGYPAPLLSGGIFSDYDSFNNMRTSAG